MRCPASRRATRRKPGPRDEEVQPLFRGSLQPDVTFFGFDLDPTLAAGDPGWYFVIQQQPTEPRFGFESRSTSALRRTSARRAPPAGHALPRQHAMGAQLGAHGGRDPRSGRCAWRSTPASCINVSARRATMAHADCFLPSGDLTTTDGRARRHRRRN